MKKLTIILLLFCGLIGHGQIYQNFQVKTDWENTLDDYIDYSIMVSGDGGKLISDTPKKWLEVSRQYGMLDSVKLAVFPSAGVATRTSTIYTHSTKLYDLGDSLRHATQTTVSLQPFISGNIAPNERWAIKNVNGGARRMTHPEISFGSTDEWSVTICFQYEGGSASNAILISGGTSILYCKVLDNNRFRFTLNGNYAYESNGLNSRIGKNINVTFVAFGNNILKAYINGYETNIVSAGTNTSLGLTNLLATNYFGTISAHIIRSQALTPSQVAAEHAVLRELFPEIPSVQIDTLTVATSNLEMVASPLGNVIPNVTLAENTERITVAADRDFSSDTGWWTKGTGVTISGGVANYSAVAAGVGLTRANAMTVGQWYKATYTLAVTTGTFRFGSQGVTRSSSGTYTEYMKAAATTLGFNAVTTFTGTLDDVSVSEVGWNDLTNLYTYLTTTGGMTAANALKEVGGWSYYSNDLTIGSVYGKQYNGYGRDLLKADIATQADWNYHIATEAELTALAALGNNALKMSGTNYWTSNNGTNSTGFTALGGGVRNATTGAFAGIKDSTAFWCGDSDKVLMLYNDGTATITEVDKTYGAYIRLLAD